MTGIVRKYACISLKYYKETDNLRKDIIVKLPHKQMCLQTHYLVQHHVPYKRSITIGEDQII